MIRSRPIMNIRRAIPADRERPAGHLAAIRPRDAHVLVGGRHPVFSADRTRCGACRARDLGTLLRLRIAGRVHGYVGEQGRGLVPRPGVLSSRGRKAADPACPGTQGRIDGGRQRAEPGGQPILRGLRVCRRRTIRAGQHTVDRSRFCTCGCSAANSIDTRRSTTHE